MHQFPCPRDIVMAMEVKLADKQKYLMPKFVVGLLMIVSYLPAILSTDQVSQRSNCDLFRGEWIRNPSPPPYTDTSCRFIHEGQKCAYNGRPDTGYLHWRWKPYNCDLPQFDPKKFLTAMRDKSWGMIGDSLLRNQMQSMLCLLSKVEKPVSIYHDKAYQSWSWYFRAHNFTLALYWAPFLLKAEFLTKVKANLHLDELQPEWASQYHKHDYVVIAAGSWFGIATIMMKNNTVVGCHACKGQYKELGIFFPYRHALRMTFNFITASDHKPVVVFRTWSPSHFENGEWFNGGICNRTVPYKKGEYAGTYVDHRNYGINMEEFGKAAAAGSAKGIRIKLLDIHHLSLLRPDGHPGPYMKFHPFDGEKNARVQSDCLHWCLPGPIDTWNGLMMEMLLNEGDMRLKKISKAST